MTTNGIPAYLKDSTSLLTAEGFTVSDVWYHGTSSALIDSILEQGLKRSGDKSIKQVAKQTMATIGNNYTESIEPIFLTQSKELAYYWAQQTIRNRSVRFEGEEQPAVIEVRLPTQLQDNVKPDVGAISLLMLAEGEQYVAFTAGLYEQNGQTAPDINLKQADRMEFLQKLGMAYYSKDIATDFISEVKE
mgnify:CR=1 FL=1